MSAAGRELLVEDKDAAGAKRVALVYAMPWHFTQGEHVEANRERKRAVLREIEAIVPVIDDGFAGVSDTRGYFSDTPLRLSGQGAVVRSGGVAEWGRSCGSGWPGGQVRK